MLYSIPVENIEALRKKAKTITKKAQKYNARIVFEEIGEEIREEEEHGQKVYHKYITVEASGEARANGWTFAGTLEHTEHGNIVRAIGGLEIPERFKDCPPHCEHCNTERRRKDTYIVYNEEREEFRQVGKACLKEYTRGLSIEQASALESWAREIEGAQYYTGGGYIAQYPVKVISKYFAEATERFGFWGSNSPRPTKETGYKYYLLDNNGDRLLKIEREALREEAVKVGFSPANISDEYIESALEWARSWDGRGDSYRDNLKVIAQMEYCEHKHFGFLASLFNAYNKAIERETERRAKEEERAKEKESEYIGDEGARITVPVDNVSIVGHWFTEWGTTYVYKFVTGANVVIWKTGKGIDLDNVKEITGTVKAHNEYNGVKQTELTRCKMKE